MVLSKGPVENAATDTLDATENQEEKILEQRGQLEKYGTCLYVATTATIPKPFFLKKKMQFYDHKEVTFFFIDNSISTYIHCTNYKWIDNYINTNS